MLCDKQYKRAQYSVVLPQNLYCPYCLQSFGKIERNEGFFKLKLEETLETLEVPWPKVLSLVFTVHSLRDTLVTGRLMHLVISSLMLNSSQPHTDTTKYFQGLMSYTHFYHQLMMASFLQHFPTQLLSDIQPGIST